MPKYSDFQAVIFDLDDTLFDNYPPQHPLGIHEASRLQAAHIAGKRHGLPTLQAFTAQQSVQAFLDAPIHSMDGAIWQMLLMAGLVNGDVIDYDEPLLTEMIALKNEVHEALLRNYGREVPGAAAFVRALAAHGFDGKLAVASNGVARDVLLSLDTIGLRSLFPAAHIVTKEDLTHAKPHPEAFTLALSRLQQNIPPERVLAIEDDPRGITSAKAAGMYACGITTRFDKQHLAGQPIAPDVIVKSYAELTQLLGLA